MVSFDTYHGAPVMRLKGFRLERLQYFGVGWFSASPQLNAVGPDGSENCFILSGLCFSKTAVNDV
jgi:hypothetical protein